MHTICHPRRLTIHAPFLLLSLQVPTVSNIADKSKWEFYAGGTGTDAKWITGDVTAAVPILDWVHHTGTTTMTYFPGIKKYILTTSTATNWPMMTEQFDTYFMESDSITGPWSIVTYVGKQLPATGIHTMGRRGRRSSVQQHLNEVGSQPTFLEFC